MKDIPPIYFYMPLEEMPAGDVPNDADITWSGFIDFFKKPGAGRTMTICSYCWSLQTLNNDHIGIQDSVIVSTMRMYRQVKKLITR